MENENNFLELQGDSYRGSRYANFAGGGTSPQGNVSSAFVENMATQANSAVRNNTPANTQGVQIPQAGNVSEGLVKSPELKDNSTASMIIGAALPFAGNQIGQAAGAAIGSGASFGDAMEYGGSSLLNKASGGLLGFSANPTNAALSGMGGQFGPATKGAFDAASAASNASSFGSGANIGGAVGGGFATAAAALLSGASFKEAAISGVGSGVGTAIGTAVAGPIGGFVGSFLGSKLGSLFGGKQKRQTLGVNFASDRNDDGSLSDFRIASVNNKGASNENATKFGQAIADTANLISEKTGGKWIYNLPSFVTNIGSKDTGTFDTGGTRISGKAGDVEGALRWTIGLGGYLDMGTPEKTTSFRDAVRQFGLSGALARV